MCDYLRAARAINSGLEMGVIFRNLLYVASLLRGGLRGPFSGRRAERTPGTCIDCATVDKSSSLINCIYGLLIAVAASSCADRPVSDQSCSFTELRPDRAVEDGHGMLQANGSTAADFFVFNESGRQVGRQPLNHPLLLEAGRYQMKVNGRVRYVDVWEGYLATCSTGTLSASGYNTDTYDVTDSTDNILVEGRLGRSVSLLPGNYNIRVNNTISPVTIRARQISEVHVGSITVRGTTGESFYVLDEADRQLGFAPLEQSLSFMPGVYHVKVNNTTRRVELAAGQATELLTGDVIISGLTDEYYYVTDTIGNALNFQRMNKPLALFPGVYNLRVNNSMVTGQVLAGQTTSFSTGSLVLNGEGSGYYYVLDENGRELNFNSLNKSLSFFPSDYTVRVGSSTRRTTVIAGEHTALDAFN